MVITSNWNNVPLIWFMFQTIVNSAHCMLKHIKLNKSAVNELLIAIDFDFDVKGFVTPF